jgi:Zn-dependent protease with chaperone function
MNQRISFPGISPSAWEHPADRAALSAFARIPGAVELVRRLVGSTTERSLRLSALGGGARASESQFGRVHRLALESARILDLSPLPETFIRLGAEPNAFTYGVDRPFLVLSSAALDFWDDDELLAVIGHEMGHILSGHAAYKTLLGLIAQAQAAIGEGLVGAAALGAITAALREWDRKSELSSDRAALLACQDPMAVYRSLMKTAGGPRAVEMDLNEFFRQAHDYDASSEGLDSLLKFLDLIGESHPLASVRMVALQEWERGGAYEKVLHGDYPRRDGEEGRGPREEFQDAKASYARDFSASQDPLSQAAGKVMETLEGILGGMRPGKGPGVGEGGPAAEDAKEGGAKGRGGEAPSVEDLFDELFRTR